MPRYNVVNTLFGKTISSAIRQHKRLRRYRRKYLSETGWIRSVATKSCVDATGQPMPWITYPAFEMLRRIVRPEHRVFEYGCGNSSLWWAKNASQVFSVEHNPEWARNISALAPPNLTIIPASRNDPHNESITSGFFLEAHDVIAGRTPASSIDDGFICEGFGAYAAAIANRGLFDIVVIDGMARTLTTWVGRRYLKESGIIVFDNSDRYQYNPAFEILAKDGFARIDFYGSGPLNDYGWCTSIFARDLSWFGNVTISETQKSDTWPTNTIEAAR